MRGMRRCLPTDRRMCNWSSNVSAIHIFVLVLRYWHERKCTPLQDIWVTVVKVQLNERGTMKLLVFTLTNEPIRVH